MTEKNLEDRLEDNEQGKKPGNWFNRLWALKRGKAAVIIAGVIVLAALLLLIPTTRYGLTAWAVKKQVTISVVGSTDGSPVSNAAVQLGDARAETDENGDASLTAPVGTQRLTVTKQYYTDYSTDYVLPLFSNPVDAEVTLTTTGRQLTFKVTNTLDNRKTVANAMIKTLDTSAKTDSNGSASIVVPVNTKDVELTLSADGFNTIKKSITLSDNNDYDVSVTASGTVYYLSKASGTVDVKKASLDGSNSSVVLKGTGDENAFNTGLLATDDWQFLALTSQRSPGDEAVYLITTKNDALTTIDRSNSTFTAIGWIGHTFFYEAYDNTKDYGDAKRLSIKAYNADTDKITTIDQNKATSVPSVSYQMFSNVHILGNELVYGRYWGYQNYYDTAADNQIQELVSVNAATLKTTVRKDFAPTVQGTFNLMQYKPEALYVRLTWDTDTPYYFKYESGAVSDQNKVSDSLFYSSYRSYLRSPDGKKVFWYEDRDGKNYLLMADANGSNQVTVAPASDYKPYGWFGNDYLLISKGNNEIFIAPVDDITKLTKITNFHSTQSFQGYGYGGVY